jgi:hypothetical protein
LSGGAFRFYSQLASMEVWIEGRDMLGYERLCVPFTRAQEAFS